MNAKPLPESLRYILDARPAPQLVPEKLVAYVLNKSPDTIRGWRGAFKPKRTSPPTPIKIGGRYFYPLEAVADYVRRTGRINPEILNGINSTRKNP